MKGVVRISATTSLADWDLIRRSASGDKTALSELFDRHAATVTRYAWALATSRQDVEEIVQDTFLTMWQKSGDIEGAGETALPWLLVVCRNHAMNLHRKQAKARHDELPDDLPAPTGEEDVRDRLRWVREEIAALPDIDRRICELCLVEGRPYAEVAALVGISVEAVTKRVSRTRARLKKAVSTNEH